MIRFHWPDTTKHNLIAAVLTIVTTLLLALTIFITIVYAASTY